MLKHLIKSVDTTFIKRQKEKFNSWPPSKDILFDDFFLSTDNTVRVQRKETAVIISQYSSLVFNSRRLWN